MSDKENDLIREDTVTEPVTEPEADAAAAGTPGWAPSPTS